MSSVAGVAVESPDDSHGGPDCEQSGQAGRDPGHHVVLLLTHGKSAGVTVTIDMSTAFCDPNTKANETCD
jgi:hypothetical protein